MSSKRHWPISGTAVLPVKKEVFGQPLGSNDLEDDLVGLQGLAVDPAGQGGVEALGQPFAYRQLLGNHLVFCIVLQNLRQDVKNGGSQACADKQCNHNQEVYLCNSHKSTGLDVMCLFFMCSWHMQSSLFLQLMQLQ